MQKFQCHKIVEAGKILSVLDLPSQPGTRLVLQGEKDTRAVTPEWVERHKPEVGGYFVRYDDGYESYSPAQAFEQGYTPVALLSVEDFTSEPILKYFKYDHLPAGLQAVSKPFAEMATTVIMQQPRSAERTVALRKLLECKDATVRAALEQADV